MIWTCPAMQIPHSQIWAKDAIFIDSGWNATAQISQRKAILPRNEAWRWYFSSTACQVLLTELQITPARQPYAVISALSSDVRGTTLISQKLSLIEVPWNFAKRCTYIDNKFLLLILLPDFLKNYIGYRKY